MATTTHHQPNSSEYRLVVSGSGSEFFLQNASKNKAVASVVWGVSVPAADTQGHPVKPGQGLVRNGLIGQVYARGLTGDVTIVVTEE